MHEKRLGQLLRKGGLVGTATSMFVDDVLVQVDLKSEPVGRLIASSEYKLIGLLTGAAVILRAPIACEVAVAQMRNKTFGKLVGQWWPHLFSPPFLFSMRVEWSLRVGNGLIVL